METEDLVKKAQQGDGKAMEDLCAQFSGLMKKNARRQHLRTIDEDAHAVARLAFVEAVKGYAPGRNVPFAGYAKSKVEFAVWNFFKRECKRWQAELSLEGKENEDGEFIGRLADQTNLAQEVEEREILRQAIKIINQLPAKQREVVFSLVFLERSLTQTAKCLGITPQAVHGLKTRAIKSMKTHKDLEDL